MAPAMACRLRWMSSGRGDGAGQGRGAVAGEGGQAVSASGVASGVVAAAAVDVDVDVAGWRCVGGRHDGVAGRSASRAGSGGSAPPVPVVAPWKVQRGVTTDPARIHNRSHLISIGAPSASPLVRQCGAWIPSSVGCPPVRCPCLFGTGCAGGYRSPTRPGGQSSGRLSASGAQPHQRPPVPRLPVECLAGSSSLRSCGLLMTTGLDPTRPGCQPPSGRRAGGSRAPLRHTGQGQVTTAQASSSRCQLCPTVGAGDQPPWRGRQVDRGALSRVPGRRVRGRVERAGVAGWPWSASQSWAGQGQVVRPGR